MPDFHFFDSNDGGPITTESFDTHEQAVEHFTSLDNGHYMLSDRAYRAAQNMIRQGTEADRYYAIAIDAEPPVTDMGVHPDTTAQAIYEQDDFHGSLEVFDLETAREVFNVPAP